MRYNFNMDKKIFKNKKANFNKLIDYGFVKKDDIYFCVVPILANQFEVQIQICSSGEMQTKTIENLSQDEYILHLTDAVGEFVGKVRDEYQKVIEDILDKCYENDIFKSKQSLEIIEYIKNKYGDDLEYLWEKFSNNAIWRRKDTKKWYGLMVVLSKRKLKIDSDEIVEIIDVRVNQNNKNLVDNKLIFEGYHMNKKSWITICLDNSVDTKDIFKLIDESYALAK